MATEDQIKMLEVLREQGLITDDQQKIIEVLSESGELDKNLPRIIRGIAKRAKQQEQEPEPEPRQPETTGERFKRTLGIGARDIAQGAASTVGIFSDPIALALNQLTPENYKFPSAREAVKNLLDRLGVPEPELEIEKRISTINEMMAGGLGGVGGGMAVSKAPATEIAKKAGAFMADNPLAQMKGLLGSAAGMYAGQESELPGGELLGLILGGRYGSKVPGEEFLKVNPKKTYRGEDAAKEFGAEVMTTDIFPPKTWLGKWASSMGDKAFFGTGKQRAQQYKKRQEATSSFQKKYNADIHKDIDLYGEIGESFLKRHRKKLNRYQALKYKIFDKLDEVGPVPPTNTNKAIDKQIERLKAINPKKLSIGIKEYEDLKEALRSKNIKNFDENRKLFSKTLADDESLASIKTVMEKSASNVYSAINKDIEAFIKKHQGQRSVDRWKVANKTIHKMKMDEKRPKLKALLRHGEREPEKIKQLLISPSRSDVKEVFKKLSPTGKTKVRTMVIRDAIVKAGGIENISPEKFRTQIRKLQHIRPVFFKGEHKRRLESYERMLDITIKAKDAGVLPPTGVQNVPLITLGMAMNSLKAAVGIIGIGVSSRLYESETVKNALKHLARTERNTPKEFFYYKRAVAAINAVMKKHEADEKKRKGER